jgi:arylsulfatase A-like enzyme
MIATLRRETCWSADSPEDATLFIASLLLSRDGRKRLGSGEWRRVPFTGQRVRLRSMEVYAGFLEYTDHHIGRLIDILKRLNILDDTLIYYIIGDNGASAEGTLNGAYNEMANFNGPATLETPEFLMD